MGNAQVNAVDAQQAQARLALIEAMAGRRIAVVGDVVADEFVYGRVARVSREAPVLILEYDSTEVLPGGAGNAANNVAALGGRVALAAVVGQDGPGRRMVQALHAGIDRSRLVRVSTHETPLKTRILAGGIHSAKQQVVRIDRGVRPVITPAVRAAFEATALLAVHDCDAVLVSDYGHGLITPAFLNRLRKAACADGPVPFLLDSRYRLLDYRGLTLSAPNESEVEAALDVKINDDPVALERAGRELLTRTKVGALLITRGSRGMALFQPGAPTVHIPIHGSDEIADVTGAGDTVMATLTLALACGASFEQAARLANYAGGVVVMKRGTATVSADELRQAVRAGAAAAPAVSRKATRARRG